MPNTFDDIGDSKYNYSIEDRRNKLEQLSTQRKEGMNQTTHVILQQSPIRSATLLTITQMINDDMHRLQK